MLFRGRIANPIKNVRGSNADKATLMGHRDVNMMRYYQSPDFESLKKIVHAL